VVVIRCTIELLSHLYRLTSHWDRGHPINSLGVLDLRADVRLAHVKLTSHHRCSSGVMHARMRGHLVHHTGHSRTFHLYVVCEVRRLILGYCLTSHLEQEHPIERIGLLLK
jgi:hypothetical protein